MLSIVGILLDGVLDGDVPLPAGSFDDLGNILQATLRRADNVLKVVFATVDDFILKPLEIIGVGSLLEEIAEGI